MTTSSLACPRLLSRLFNGLLLLSGASTILAQGGIGGNTMTCSAPPIVTPTIRAEGFSERVGDVILSCTGGTPVSPGNALPTADITLFLNTQITSHQYANGWSEVLLLIDEPGSMTVPGAPATQLACADPNGVCTILAAGSQTFNGSVGQPNVFEGIVSSNTVRFPSVPIASPGANPNTIFRITNLRVNAAAFPPGNGVPPTISGFLSISPSNSFSINQPSFTLATIQPGLTFSVRTPDNSTTSSGFTVTQCAGGAAQRTGALRFAENFPTAFAQRSSAAFVDNDTSPAPVAQNIPGYIWNTETFFYAPALSAPTVDFTTVGLADWGTRLRAEINGIPAGANVFVSTGRVDYSNGNPIIAAAGAVGRLIAGDSQAFIPLPATTTLEGIPVAQLQVFNGTATAVWEVLRNVYTSNQNLDFVVWVQPAGAPVGTATVSGSYAPTLPGPEGSTVPQFLDTSVPNSLFSIAACTVPAAVTSPSPGSTLTSSNVTFQWTTGTGTSNLYWLRVGTTGVGSYDVSASEYAGTSASVSGIPSNGETVYVRLYSLNLASNTWISNDYTYTAAGSVGAAFVPGAITSPTSGSTLSGPAVTFQWSTGTGASNLYWLRVGTTGVGSYDVSASEYSGTSATVSGIPSNGETVYVRLFSLNLASNTWISNDYTYTAAGSVGGAFVPGAITSPASGSTLSGSAVTFQWNAGTSTANLYWLRVGTTGVGSYDVSANEYAGTSAAVSGIPSNGETVYVRLYSLNSASNTWVPNDYTYTAAGSVGGSFVPGAITSPAAGSTLTSSNVTFQWNAGTSTANLYWLRVGTTGVGSYDVSANEYAGTSATVSGIPGNGETVYVRLYSLNSAANTWISNDYTYTAAGSVGGAFVPGAITSPTSGSTLSGSAVTFQWNAGTSTANLFWLRVGTTGVGSYDVSANEYAGTSAAVFGIPGNGETVYVRLYSLNSASNIWVPNDYTYTAAGSGGGSFVPGAITSPTPGSQLSGSAATFQWTSGTGTTGNYWIRVGTTGPGAYDLFAGEFAATSASISGLPSNGVTLYVRLYSQNAGTGAWVSNDYTYMAF